MHLHAPQDVYVFTRMKILQQTTVMINVKHDLFLLDYTQTMYQGNKNIEIVVTKAE